MYRSLTTLLLLAISFTAVNAQKHNWHLLSPKKRHMGTGVEDAYKLLQGRTPKTVIVALIDVGTDIDHPDLKGMIWTNPKEIPNNGIDDDGNGYVDDIHGWNFLGGKNADIEYDAEVSTRIYQRYKRMFRNVDTTAMNDQQKADFIKYKQARTDYHKAQYNRVRDSIAAKFAYQMDHQWFWRQIFHLFLGGKNADKQIKEAYDMAAVMPYYNRIDADSMRRAVIDDDPENPHERYYGNNHVIGPEPSHGTHTAGIVAALRDNGIGAEGVTNNVRIMVIRAVPWGDEHDKDIANAIRYAVDNGASIISMSFGKYASPHKAVVDSAVQYAVSKDVLLVHGSGNESKDEDHTPSYPDAKLLSGGNVDASWIEVGASGLKRNKKLAASFSNYGKETVDLFAPGVKIYSTLPHDSYGRDDGTSMATPVVAGIAAMIRSYFPNLTAPQVKQVLMQTATHYYGRVRVPGHKKTYEHMNDLCASGGIVNAEAAVRELISRKR